MYYVNFHTGAGNHKAHTLLFAMETADGKACYTGESITIEDYNNEEIMIRRWNSTRDGIENEKNPIDFGRFGYYSDWEDL